MKLWKRGPLGQGMKAAGESESASPLGLGGRIDQTTEKGLNVIKPAPAPARLVAPATRLSRFAFFADFYVYPAAAATFMVLAIVSNLQRGISDSINLLPSHV